MSYLFQGILIATPKPLNLVEDFSNWLMFKHQTIYDWWGNFSETTKMQHVLDYVQERGFINSPYEAVG